MLVASFTHNIGFRRKLKYLFQSTLNLKQHYLGFCMELVKELNGFQLSIFKILFRTTFDKSDNEESCQA